MRHFLLSDYEVETTAAEKATKRDDAEVPEHLWNYRIAYLLGTKALDPSQQKALNLLRTTMLLRWKKNVLNSWRKWWSTTRMTGRKSNLCELLWVRGVRACDHALQSTFWLWPKGSGVFFWQWPSEYLLDLAAGVPPFWIGKPDERITQQKNLGDQSLVEKIAEKLNDVQAKSYKGPGHCVVTMNFFAVPKGDTDICMVYDGTKSGVNKCLYAPWFPLPDGDVLVNTLDDGYWCIDNDYGKMFLSFGFIPTYNSTAGWILRPCMDVGLTANCGLKSGIGARWGKVLLLTARCNRLDGSSALYGDRTDGTNVFDWSHVHLNIPGTPSYCPGIPWLSKRRQDGTIAADAHDYINYLRVCAATEEDAWRVGSRIAKTASFYGVQDAARKRRQQTQQAGAWAGVVCGTSPDCPFVLVTQEKWD
ncbi:hypothetical protein ACA910_002965 [Epithemia clementina (nom. ined.)]